MFHRREVPGPIRSVRHVLGKLAAAPSNIGLKRLTTGFYIKGELLPKLTGPGFYWSFEIHKDLHVIQKFFGHERGGYGLAGHTAAQVLGWRKQPPAEKRTEICVVSYFPLVAWPLQSKVDVVHRSNKRRKVLTPAEVTVLESVKHSDVTDWGKHVERVESNPYRMMDLMSAELNSEHLIIKTKDIMWAAQKEYLYKKHKQLRHLLEALPDILA